MDEYLALLELLERSPSTRVFYVRLFFYFIYFNLRQSCAVFYRTGRLSLVSFFFRFFFVFFSRVPAVAFGWIFLKKKCLSSFFFGVVS